jgi:predicted transcriptional regulator
MMNAMQEVKTLVNHLPDSSSIEDVQYHLYVLEKIRKGQNAISNGNHFTSDEVRQRLNKWLNP